MLTFKKKNKKRLILPDTNTYHSLCIKNCIVLTEEQTDTLNRVQLKDTHIHMHAHTSHTYASIQYTLTHTCKGT